MAKTVDLNERALEKERRSFVRFCDVCGGFCGFLIVFMIAGFIAYGYEFIKGIVADGAIEDIISDAANIVACVGIGISVRFGAAVFGKLTKGGTPFTYDVADKIKGASVPLIVSGGIGFATEIAVVIMTEGFGFAADKFDFFGGLDILVFGLALSALSYIFSYGCKLQQESDETI